MGHIKKLCQDFKAEREHQHKAEKECQKEDKINLTKQPLLATTCEESDSESSKLIANHALAAVNPNNDYAYSVDLGATCHTVCAIIERSLLPCVK